MAVGIQWPYLSLRQQPLTAPCRNAIFGHLTKEINGKMKLLVNLELLTTPALRQDIPRFSNAQHWPHEVSSTSVLHPNGP